MSLQVYWYGVGGEGTIMVMIVWIEMEGYALWGAASTWAEGFRVRCVCICCGSVETSSHRTEECCPTGAEPAGGREPSFQELLQAEVDTAWTYSVVVSKEESRSEEASPDAERFGTWGLLLRP
jgi:hypothetical protein